MNPQLTTRLRHLRLSGMVEALPGRVAQAEAAPLPHLEFLELLVEDELARRADRLFARRLKQAGIITRQDARRLRLEFQSEDPEDQARRARERALRPDPRRRAAHRPARRRQIAHRDRHRRRRDSRRPPRARPQHVRSGRRLRRSRRHRTRRDFVQQLTRVDLLVLEDFGMKKLGLERRRRPPGGLRPSARNGLDAHHHESPHARLGRLPRRRARGHRDPRSLPRARHDRPDDRQELSAAPTRERRRPT